MDRWRHTVFKRVLRAADCAVAGAVDGEPGVLNHSGLVFSGACDLQALDGANGVPFQGRLRGQGVRRSGVDCCYVQPRCQWE